MTDNKKPKLQQLTTPVGTAMYAHLNKADSYSPPGSSTPIVKFKTKLKVLRTVASDLVEKLEAAVAEGKAMADKAVVGKKNKAGKPLVPELNDVLTVEVDDQGNETGYIIISAASKNKPALFDAQGKPTQVEVWSGSQIKLNISPAPYYIPATNKYGAAIYLNAVQIIGLVSKGINGRGADGFGFSKEDGFVQEVEEVSKEGVTDGAPVAEAAASGEF